MIKASNLCRGLTAGIVIARGIRIADSGEKQRAELEEAARAYSSYLQPPETSEAVRNMLRTGGFKPSGRNKPASEYLMRAAREGVFPFINNAVDVINLLSLQWGLPISLLDLDAAGDCIDIKIAPKGESFIFNRSGQSLDISGLMSVYGGGRPIGSPVKDSMAGKLTGGSSNAIAVIYAPSELCDRLDTDMYCRALAKRMREYANAEETAAFVI